jgi:2-polyprenyl-3-methyl-5-hydroxy-6-metoxy-1,4-benzoquinol methylase
MIRLKRWFRGDPVDATAPRDEPPPASPLSSGAADQAEAHYRTGNALREQGKLDEALASYQSAISLRADFADAHVNAGLVLEAQGHAEDAAESYERAIALKPDDAIAHNNLGHALDRLGQPDAALASYGRALELHDVPEFKSNVVRCLKRAHFTRVDDSIRRLAVRALTEPWAWKSELSRASIRLITADPTVAGCVDRASAAWPRLLSAKELFGANGLAALAGDRLLGTLLESAPIDDVAMERCLTVVRRIVLETALSSSATADPAGETLAFYCALARQCFINNYVYTCGAEELADATALRAKLVAGLDGRGPVPALWIAAVAAYFPLLSVAGAETLPDRGQPDAVRGLLAQQIAEALEEQRDRASLTSLTPIDEGVSRAVRQQYEESPYPRWVRLPPPVKALTIDDYLRWLFPAAAFRPLGKSRDLDVLVAGCGTGAESNWIARQLAGAQVLAVDLSLSSLCYAKRKTRELGVRNIEYAQADIMKLGSIARRFDVISSSGVLHHLGDPIAGLHVLLSLLRPGGFMHVALYSEIARRRVVAARRFIAERGYQPTVEDIRRCRQDLMDRGDEFAGLTHSSDFYSTSECRDLLFHVQEHRFTLPQVKEVFRDAGLQLVGMTRDREVAVEYAARFPDDPAQTDLDHWHSFETGFPDTFTAMYDFWVQKPVGP